VSIAIDPVRINETAEVIHKNSVAHGFYDEPRTFDRHMMLIVGEATEAHEEFRSGRHFTEIYYNAENLHKPEGIPVELADIIIRVLDTAYHLGIDIGAAMKLKHEYNVTRPYKHGRQF
jgi:NTP pyrophosphatase (non-canonical NTP hydrolase)